MLLDIKRFFETIDQGRDKLLAPFIKKYWPRAISPNHLTIVRFILSFYIIYLFLSGYDKGVVLFAIFIIAALTDLFDGSVARVLKKETFIGIIMDPIADKLLILPFAIFILYEHYFILLVLLILPELISGVMSLNFKKQSRVLKPTIFGKIKMLIECIAFSAIILFNFPEDPAIINIVLLYCASLFAFFNMFLNWRYPPPLIK